MRKVVSAIVLFGAVMPVPVLGAPVAELHHVKVTAPSATCTKLAGDYEGVSKRLAYNHFVSDSRDDAGIAAEGQTTLTLLAANHCELPTSAPSARAYISQAMGCSNALKEQELDQRLAQMSGRASGLPPMPQECDMGVWKPEQN